MIDRREAVKRITAILGYSLSASTLAGVAAGCGPAADGVRGALSEPQRELLDVLTEHILPQTDTPGARAAQVSSFIDTMLTDFYAADERSQFLAGLSGLDERARSAQGAAFLQLDPSAQFALLDAMDAEAFPDMDAMSEAQREAIAAQRRRDGRPFIMRLKELTLAGYYTSEIGATQELHVNPMGFHRGDIPLDEVGRAWA